MRPQKQLFAACHVYGAEKGWSPVQIRVLMASTAGQRLSDSMTVFRPSTKQYRASAATTVLGTQYEACVLCVSWFVLRAACKYEYEAVSECTCSYLLEIGEAPPLRVDQLILHRVNETRNMSHCTACHSPVIISALHDADYSAGRVFLGEDTCVSSETVIETSRHLAPMPVHCRRFML